LKLRFDHLAFNFEEISKEIKFGSKIYCKNIKSELSSWSFMEISIRQKKWPNQQNPTIFHY